MFFEKKLADFCANGKNLDIIVVRVQGEFLF